MEEQYVAAHSTTEQRMNSYIKNYNLDGSLFNSKYVSIIYDPSFPLPLTGRVCQQRYIMFLLGVGHLRSETREL